MLDRIKGAWPKFSDNLQATVYTRLVFEVASAHGRDAVERMIYEAINREHELPSPAKLRVYIPQGTSGWRSATDQDCPSCGGSGWERVFAGTTVGHIEGSERKLGRPVDPKIGAVKRCHCWRKVQSS